MRWLLPFVAIIASAADLTGIWTGQVTGRNGQKEDVAFQFKQSGVAVTGKLFGDEFDLKLEDVAIDGDQIKFTVTTTNYYSGTQQKVNYAGTIKGNEIELTRTSTFRQGSKQTFTLKRLTNKS